ncbi:MAG: hypothetical protein GYA17_16310 [Chloroflexi bacterium]|nr:hypothetical protein [Anaerolineaceae bacterium]NMB89922.1 hypothetical protein [Chloroflexota bacterium]
MIANRLIDAILQQYRMPWNGTHGISHWARMYETGERLAPLTGANPEVVRLFALLHDSQRVNEAVDDDHGLRAARYARSLRGDLIHLDDAAFELLYQACAGHTNGTTQADVTIQTCWDCDRLDLGRAGITPQPNLLCTAVARQPEILQWALERGRQRYVPEFVYTTWGIERGLL